VARAGGGGYGGGGVVHAKLLEILKQASNISKFIVLGLHSDLCWFGIKRYCPPMYGAHHLQVLGNNVSANA